MAALSRAVARHVALLRAVNVGGRNPVPMAGLRALCADLGLAGATTLLASGNVVFDAGRRTGAALERALEGALAERMGVVTDVLVRTAGEWDELVAGNPFRREAEDDPGHLLVMALKAAPTPAAVRALQASIQGPELVRARGRALYAVYPDGVGRSRLTAARIEAALGARGTARNWSTVRKLAELLRA